MTLSLSLIQSVIHIKSTLRKQPKLCTRKSATGRMATSFSKLVVRSSEYLLRSLPASLACTVLISSYTSIVTSVNFVIQQSLCIAKPMLDCLHSTAWHFSKKLHRCIKGDRNVHKRKNKKVYGALIELYPDSVNVLKGVGQWEGDLVKGIRSVDEPALMLLTQRYCRTEIIVKMPDYHADAFELHP